MINSGSLPKPRGKHLNVFTIIAGKMPNASHYYRQLVPLLTMHEHKKVMPYIDLNDMSLSMERRAYLASYCDVNLMYQPIGGMFLKQLEACKTWVPARSGGQWRWPPSWVIDTDDNLFNVHPSNPQFSILGVKNIDGTPLGPRDKIMQRDEQGRPQRVWWPGRKTLNGEFDVTKNIERIEMFRAGLKLADGITCSTPALRETLERELGYSHPPIFVTPNAVRPADYPEVELREHPREVRVLWPASATHYEDIYPLLGACARLARKYKHVTWWLWGGQYKVLVDALPSDRVRCLQWVAYPEFKARLAAMNHDITIAPLVPHVFNRCRSAIKWYESSVICKPAAVVAQKGPSYNEIEDGVTGMLFDTPAQFYDKLATLIENPRQRVEMARSAQQWVHENRHADKVIPRLFEFYRSLREEKRRQLPIGKRAQTKRSVADNGEAKSRGKRRTQERQRGSSARRRRNRVGASALEQRASVAVAAKDR